ncbi:MAG TPA: CDP-archaeol synthase [Candidatus Nanoarchaeia archaeon]|nr:CDP-archaeol synthase [Candidatus Nanoarchaeia archaeon]
MVWLLILKSLYFFLPAYLANMAPVLTKKVPFLNQPVWEKKLGKNKTWRGMVMAVLTGTAVFALQKYVYQQGWTGLALIDYNGFSILSGTLLGGGAILGDVVKSYFKRKRKIAPGERWIPWDQLDFVLGGLILGCLLYVPAVEVVVIIVLASPFLHIAFNHLGYALKINKSRW